MKHLKKLFLALYHFVAGFFKKIFKSEVFYIQAILYLSLLSIVLVSFHSNASESKVENQLLWLNSLRLEDRLDNRYTIAKILYPLIDSKVLRSSAPEKNAQIAYDAYLEFIGKLFSTKEEYDKELAVVQGFDDLKSIMDSEDGKKEIDKAYQKRQVYSESITASSITSSRLFRAIVWVQVFTVWSAATLETIRLKRKKKEKSQQGS